MRRGPGRGSQPQGDGATVCVHEGSLALIVIAPAEWRTGAWIYAPHRTKLGSHSPSDAIGRRPASRAARLWPLPVHRHPPPVPCDDADLRLANQPGLGLRRFPANPAGKRDDARNVLHMLASFGMAAIKLTTASELSQSPSSTPIHSARLLRALKLLAQGAAVTTTSIALGYDNVATFIALFRRTCGCTPHEYVKDRVAGGGCTEIDVSKSKLRDPARSFKEPPPPPVMNYSLRPASPDWISRAGPCRPTRAR
jgi:AraC-like DNA-binding protein